MGVSLSKLNSSPYSTPARPRYTKATAPSGTLSSLRASSLTPRPQRPADCGRGVRDRVPPGGWLCDRGRAGWRVVS